MTPSKMPKEISHSFLRQLMEDSLYANAGQNAGQIAKKMGVRRTRIKRAMARIRANTIWAGEPGWLE